MYIETKSYKVTVEEAGLVFMMRIIERSDDFLRSVYSGKRCKRVISICGGFSQNRTFTVFLMED